MRRRDIPYTAQELAWIEERQTTPRRDLHSEFCAVFVRSDVSLENFKALCTRKGFKTGRTGKYEPGAVPMNKGKKMPYHPNSAKTQFKKGQVPPSAKGPGHETICPKDGYVFIIVAERNPYTGADTRRVLKHKWLWEKENGPVPEGHCLKSVDGNRANSDPQNWIAIPRALLPRLAGRWTNLNYDKAEPELRPYILAAARLKHAAATRLNEARVK